MRNIDVISLFSTGGIVENLEDFSKMEIIKNGILLDESKHEKINLYFREKNGYIRIFYAKNDKIIKGINLKLNVNNKFIYDYKLFKKNIVLPCNFKDFKNQLELIKYYYSQFFNDVLEKYFK